MGSRGPIGPIGGDLGAQGHIGPVIGDLILGSLPFWDQGVFWDLLFGVFFLSALFGVLLGSFWVLLFWD